MYIICILTICISVVGAHGSDCTPRISDSTPDKDNFRQIECDISLYCDNVVRIIFDKADTYATWQQVFVGVNKTYYYTVDPGLNNYTLTGRNDYTAFHTKHLLYVKPLIPLDQGKWRCLVQDKQNVTYASNTMELTVYVTPTAENLSIRPGKTAMVANKTREFRCTIAKIHPEPDVVWEVNGIEHFLGNASNRQRSDGLWFVRNTIRLTFNSVGDHILSCILKTKTRDPWLEKHITLDIQEPASIMDPTDDVDIFANIDITFTLNCIGKGYKPRIQWTRNGEDIFDSSSSYIIKSKCNTSFCNSSITSKQVDITSACADENPGLYTCVVLLEDDKYSSHESAYMRVYMPRNLCRATYFRRKYYVELHLGIVIGVSIFISVIVTSLVVFLLFLWIRKNQKFKDKNIYKTVNSYDTSSLNSKAYTQSTGSDVDNMDNNRDEHSFGAPIGSRVEDKPADIIQINNNDCVAYTVAIDKNDAIDT